MSGRLEGQQILLPHPHGLFPVLHALTLPAGGRGQASGRLRRRQHGCESVAQHTAQIRPVPLLHGNDAQLRTAGRGPDGAPPKREDEGGNARIDSRRGWGGRHCAFSTEADVSPHLPGSVHRCGGSPLDDQAGNRLLYPCLGDPVCQAAIFLQAGRAFAAAL